MLGIRPMDIDLIITSMGQTGDIEDNILPVYFLIHKL